MSTLISIKARIVARYLELLEGLKDPSIGFREVSRQQSLSVLATKTPACHLVIGDELTIDEDNIGYTIEFPALVKLMIDDARDPYAVTDLYVPWIQKTVEADAQLSGLVNWCKYAGEKPFTTEILKPKGGSIVGHLIQYRRKHGEPETSYL